MQLPPSLELLDGGLVRVGRRKLVYFAGCDYFRLSRHPVVRRALEAGLRQHGLTVAASRWTTGNHRLYAELEASLAAFFGAPAALLTGNGYAANGVAAQALRGEVSHAIIDAKAHPSLQDAARALDCPVIPFEHRDPASLAAALRRAHRPPKPLLLTDGLFAHDGALAPLPDYLRLLPPGGLVLLDDAHAAGVLGKRGQGMLEHFGLPRRRVIQTITLSKAIGVYGGAILCDARLRQKMVARSHLFAGSTPLPLPLAAAALAAVRLLKSGTRSRRRLAATVIRAKNELRSQGFVIPDTPAPIIAVAPRSAAEAASLKRRLLNRGIFPSFIRYPGAPKGGYFRFALSSEHSAAQVAALVEALGVRL